MKNTLFVMLLVVGVAALFTSCETKTVYIDRTVYVTPKPKPKPRAVTPAPRPRMDNPDNFDAVGKPTSYSY